MTHKAERSETEMKSIILCVSFMLACVAGRCFFFRSTHATARSGKKLHEKKNQEENPSTNPKSIFNTGLGTRGKKGSHLGLVFVRGLCLTLQKDFVSYPSQFKKRRRIKTWVLSSTTTTAQHDGIISTSTC